MLKPKLLFTILLLTIFLASSCKRTHHAKEPSSQQQTTSPANAASNDTIKANLAANDKSTQMLEDGSVMIISNTIAENLANSRNNSTFLSLIEKSGLYKTLAEKGSFTVFVPSNEAFEKLDKRSLDRLMTDEGRQDLEKILKFHIIGGILRLRDLTAGESLSTIEGDPLVVIIENGKTKLMDGNGNMVEITRPDILNKNGIIHLTNGVLLPKGINLY